MEKIAIDMGNFGKMLKESRQLRKLLAQ